MTIQNCDICGELAAENKSKETEYTYKGQSFVINQMADWCDACGEGVINPKDNLASAVDMQTAKAKIDGLLPPLAIKAIRLKLGLTQKEASERYGGGVNAFSRYENGVNPPSRSLSLLLIALESEPSVLEKAIAKSNGSFDYLMTENNEGSILPSASKAAQRKTAIRGKHKRKPVVRSGKVKAKSSKEKIKPERLKAS